MRAENRIALVVLFINLNLSYLEKRAPLLIVVSDLKTRRTEHRNPSYPPNEVFGARNKLIEVPKSRFRSWQYNPQYG